MSDMTDWTVQPREPGWFGRLIAPQGGGRPATLTFVLGTVAAGAFVGSLALDWQSVTVPSGAGLEEPIEQHFSSGIASIDTLGLVYTLGVVALLGVVGAVVTRPEVALRLRMATAGVTVALVGVLVAVTLRLSEAIASVPSIFFGLSAEQLQRLTFSYEPGIFCGFAAAVLPGVAIWRAGQLAARAAAAADAPAGTSASAGASRREPARSGPARLDVAFSEPLDLSVGPGEALPFR